MPVKILPERRTRDESHVVPAPGWKNVRDELPEKGIWVLIAKPDHTLVQVGDRRIAQPHPWRYRMAYRDESKWRHDIIEAWSDGDDFMNEPFGNYPYWTHVTPPV